MNNLIKCAICNYETQNHQSFNSHISHAHHIKSKDYYDKYIKKTNEGLCETCGKHTNFINMWKGYRLYCCNSCMSSNKEIQMKRKQTSLMHYGVEFPHQSEIIKNNMRKTCIAKYGSENVYASDYGKQKIKKTNLEKYGVDNPAKNEKIKNKIVNTNIKRYSTTTPLTNTEIKEKIKHTWLKKYGEDNPNKSNIIKSKIKNTCISRYGVSSFMKTDKFRQRTLETAYTREARIKAAKTAKQNGNHSSLEDFLEEFFIKNNIIYEVQYNKDPRYPYFCDFYLPDKDIFIEINGYWTHGGHWFDKNNKNDLQLLAKWKKKNSPQYKTAINVWTKLDVNKRQTALKNKINYIVLWNKQDIINFINSFK